MHIRKRIFASLILTGCMAVSAMARQQMTVYFNNGNAESSFAVSDVASLHFSDGNLLVKQNADGKQSAISLAEILSIKFADRNPSEVKTVGDGLAAVKVAASADELRLIGYDTARPQPAVLYGIGGTVFYSVSAQTAGSINISSLPKGIYILKLGNKSFKISK